MRTAWPGIWGVRPWAVQDARRDADSWTVTGTSEFERILDAQVAAEACPPFMRPPVVEGRPDPAIRFAMWGGGVPPVTFGHSPWVSAKVRGVSPWATDTDRPAADATRYAAGTAGPTTRTDQTAQQPPWARPAPVADGPRQRPSTSRVARVLTAADRASLDTLRKFGAVSLPDSYTAEELKAAYRQLAFRLHPDQHPEADANARLELGREFASVHAAYRRLAGR